MIFFSFTLREEKAVLDIFLVCVRTLPFVRSMKVDEKGELKLTNFHKFRGQKTTHSDHNIVTLNCKFPISQTNLRESNYLILRILKGNSCFKI